MPAVPIEMIPFVLATAFPFTSLPIVCPASTSIVLFVIEIEPKGPGEGKIAIARIIPFEARDAFTPSKVQPVIVRLPTEPIAIAVKTEFWKCTPWKATVAPGAATLKGVFPFITVGMAPWPSGMPSMLTPLWIATEPAVPKSKLPWRFTVS